jgi:hypothetical protein
MEGTRTTKMEQKMASEWGRAWERSEMWPACKAPMVGTNPTRRPSRLHASRSARTSATSLTTFTRFISLSLSAALSCLCLFSLNKGGQPGQHNNTT